LLAVTELLFVIVPATSKPIFHAEIPYFTAPIFAPSGVKEIGCESILLRRHGELGELT
jgi:hypothetical protein